MPEPPAISDLLLVDLERRDGRLAVLSAEQHILRRFGSLELLALETGCQTDFTQRGEADEFWAPVEGQVTVTLADRRPRSPSSGFQLSIELDAAHPQGLLIPFGVAYAFTAHGAARLLRLATHSDATHPDDAAIPADGLIASTG